MTTLQRRLDPAEAGLVPLPLPCPGVLLAACGYGAGRRFVALSWAGDDVWYDDGLHAGTARWRAFLHFTTHHSVAAALAGYDVFGSNIEEAPHRLLIDALDLMLYVGAAADVQRFLGALSLRMRAVSSTADQLHPLGRRAVPGLSADDGYCATAEECELLEALDRWLARLETCP